MTDDINIALEFLDQMIRVRAGIAILLALAAIIVVLQVSSMLCLRAIRLDIASCQAVLASCRAALKDLAGAPSSTTGEARETFESKGRTNLPSGFKFSGGVK